MIYPLLACLILTGIHVYLGVHIVERKVIFADLALAQIAALGASVSFLFGHDLHDPITYLYSLGATFTGAIIFALTRTEREEVPHEAMIGIVYAVSAAAAILILSRAAEGDEHLRHMLVGNILLVEKKDVMKLFLLYGTIGFIHWCLRSTFILISTQPQEAFRQKIPVKKWDLLFYLLFGVVVTSSVQIAGVLLVFGFLIIPVVAAMLFRKDFSGRLVLGWILGVLSSTVGVSLSYHLDLPTGAALVCTLGLMLLIAAAIKKSRLLK